MPPLSAVAAKIQESKKMSERSPNRCQEEIQRVNIWITMEEEAHLALYEYLIYRIQKASVSLDLASMGRLIALHTSHFFIPCPKYSYRPSNPSHNRQTPDLTHQNTHTTHQIPHTTRQILTSSEILHISCQIFYLSRQISIISRKTPHISRETPHKNRQISHIGRQTLHIRHQSLI